MTHTTVTEAIAYDCGYRAGKEDATDRIAELEATAKRRATFEVAETLLNWMNETDTENMTTKEFRKQLNMKLLSLGLE